MINAMDYLNHQNLNCELESRILHGLLCEWKEIWATFQGTHPTIMLPPLFSLSDMKGKLACWHPAKREITLSREFVINHHWDSICEVLRHEIAHQYVTEVMHAPFETAHGNAFIEACRTLRANPEASGSYPTLRDRLHHEREEDRIMHKVKKLMALAESSHKHEAEQAVAKAHQLIRKHNIELIHRNEKRDYTSIFPAPPKLRHFREEYKLSHLLIEHYFVEGIWPRAYVISKGKMGTVLEISGTAGNVKIAEYVHTFINNHIDRSWEEYKKGRKLNRSRKTDFSIGVIDGFDEKLKSQKSASSETSEPHDSTALVKIDDKQLKEYIARKYPSLTTIRRKGPRVDAKIMDDGKSIGNKLVLHKGIETNAHSPKTFLIDNR